MGIYKRLKFAMTGNEKHLDFKAASLATSIENIIYNSTSSKFYDSKALQNATVFRCVDVISNGIAQVPMRLYKKDRLGATEEIAISENNLAYLMSIQPNKYVDIFEFKKILGVHLIVYGNAYVEKLTYGNEIKELIIHNPVNVSVQNTNDRNLLYYHVTLDNGSLHEVRSKDMWHIRDFASTDVQARSRIAICREVIQTALALDSFIDGYMQSNGVVSGIITSKYINANAQYAELAAKFKEQFTNRDKNGIAILPEGTEYKPLSSTNRDAQLIENANAQILNICRIFGVSPLFVFQQDKVVGAANAEQLAIQHKVFTLDPYYTKIESSARVNLLSKQDILDGYYFKFEDEAMLRGDSKTKAEVYSIGLGNASITINEVRAKDGRPPVEWGDKPFSVNNMKDGAYQSSDSIAPEKTVDEDNNDATE